MKARALFLLILPLSFALFFFRLGDRSFRNPDEGRYAEISREMALSGDWVQPKLYGLDYLRKPPLFYWLLAASFKAFGFGEWQARLVPAFFGIFGVLLTYVFTRRIFSAQTALFASLILLSNLWYVQVGRFLVIDMVFSFFVVASLYWFYLGHAEARHKKGHYLLFFVSMAAAFLAKGMLGFAIPVSIVGVYLLSTKQVRRTVSEMNLFACLAAAALVIGTWLVPISMKEPQFWSVFIFREHFQRLASKGFEHQEPWFFYPVLLFLFFLPWALFFEPLRRAFRALKASPGRNALYFCVLSVALPVFFLSLSRSKLATYILPVIPFASIFIGHGWTLWIEDKESSRCRRLEKIFYSLAGTMMICSTLFVFVLESVNAEYTNKLFAEALSTRLKPEDRVYIYDHPGPFYDFAFYLGHPVKTVGLEGEFESAVYDDETSAVSVKREDFDRMLADGEKFFCLIRRSDFKSLDASVLAGLRIVWEDRRKVLFESGALI